MRGSIVYGLLAIVAMLVVQSDAVKCNDREVGDFGKDDGGLIKKDKSTVTQCKKACASAFAKINLDGMKWANEIGTCYEGEDGKENKIMMLFGADKVKYSLFNCDSEMCNVKDSPEYKQTMSLQNAVDEVAEKLKGKSTDLKCHDKNGESVDCKGGLCLFFRIYDETNYVTGAGCVSPGEEFHYLDVMKKKLGAEAFGDHGFLAVVSAEGKAKAAMLTAYCSTTDCNKEGSLDKEFDGIMAKTSGFVGWEKIPETTSAPETTTSYSNGYSLFLSIIVVLAVFNM